MDLQKFNRSYKLRKYFLELHSTGRDPNDNRNPEYYEYQRLKKYITFATNHVITFDDTGSANYDPFIRGGTMFGRVITFEEQLAGLLEGIDGIGNKEDSDISINLNYLCNAL